MKRLTSQTNLILATLLLTAAPGFAQEMSKAPAADNQCRVQAKEIALKTYQTCVSETRSAKIEQIRKEYQEKLNSLKKDYETQIKELKGAVAASAQTQESKINPQENKTEKSTIETPKTTIEAPSTTEVPPAMMEPSTVQAPVQEENLTLDSTQPTIILKPASPEKNTSGKKGVAKKSVTKYAKKIIAQNRLKGEKGVKGIAKTLPVKQKIVDTKPASSIITESELSKTAPIQESELEKSEIAQAPMTELNSEGISPDVQSEKLNIIDPSITSPQADAQGSEVQNLQQQ